MFLCEDLVVVGCLQWIEEHYFVEKLNKKNKKKKK